MKEKINNEQNIEPNATENYDDVGTFRWTNFTNKRWKQTIKNQVRTSAIASKIRYNTIHIRLR